MIADTAASPMRPASSMHASSSSDITMRSSQNSSEKRGNSASGNASVRATW